MTITPVFVPPPDTGTDGDPDWTDPQPEPGPVEPAEPAEADVPRSPADDSVSARARRYAHADLHGTATPEQSLWLAEHPQLWLRALTALDQITRLKIKETNLEMAGLVRPPDHQTRNLAAHRAAYARLNRRQAGRNAYRAAVLERMDDLVTLFGVYTICQLHMAGDVYAQFVHMADLLTAGDTEQALKMAHRWAELWADHIESPAAPTDEENDR